MSRRLSLSASAVGLLVAVVGGCTDDLVPSNCLIEKFRIEGTPLTLLPDARIDRVGDSFVLLGTDGENVRWASLGPDGAMGAEHVIPIPAHVAGRVWFAVAGTVDPMDHLVVAYVPAGADTTGMVDLMTFSVAFDNTMPTLPMVVGQIPAGAKVAMASGRGGRQAALTWAGTGTPHLWLRILGGDGRAIGADLTLVQNVGNFGCLRFSPGKGDMTVGYVDMSKTPPNPVFEGREISAAGMAEPPFRLGIGVEPLLAPGCVELVPTDTGYGVAWHSEGIGTAFGVFEPASSQFPNQVVLGDVRLKEIPTLGGLGWMGKQYALVFARDAGAEVWPIDAMGHRKGSLPVFPSAVGHTGSLSTQPVGALLYATYADYTSTDLANTSAGHRFLVKLSCP